MIEKSRLRVELRAARRTYLANLSEVTRGLILLRPPAPIARMTQAAVTIGLYHASRDEAPTRSYARWYQEQGQDTALPWFAERGAVMRFRRWRDSDDDAGLEPGPWGASQPPDDAPEVEPDVVFVPLLGFTQTGQRLGQGGGHYDRWLAAHPAALALGLAWDCQLLDDLPQEPHDCALRAVITPTRIHGDIA